VGTEDADFERRPDWQRMEYGTQHAVDILVLKPECLVLLARRPLAIVFEAVALGAQDIKAQFEDAKEQEERNGIDDKEPENPAPRQALHHFRIRQDPVPPRDRRKREKHIVG